MEVTSLSYQILNGQVGVELVYAGKNVSVVPLDHNDGEGLRSIALNNFTGRLIFHHHHDPAFYSNHQQSLSSSDAEEPSCNLVDEYSFGTATAATHTPISVPEDNEYVDGVPLLQAHKQASGSSSSTPKVANSSSSLSRFPPHNKPNKHRVGHMLARMRSKNQVDLHEAASSEDHDSRIIGRSRAPLGVETIVIDSPTNQQQPQQQSEPFPLDREGSFVNKQKSSFASSHSNSTSLFQTTNQGVEVQPRLPTSRPHANFQRVLSNKALLMAGGNAVTIRHTIPDFLRSQRSALRGFGTSNRQSLPLHELCAQPNVTVEELFDCLNDHPLALSTVDAQGRYPLHILGDNETLVTSDTGREAATVFGNHLMNEFPKATWTPDRDGFVPFCRILSDWVQYWNSDECHASQPQQPEASRNGYSSGGGGGNLRTSTKYRRPGSDGPAHNLFGSSITSTDYSSDETRHWRLPHGRKKVFSRVHVWEEVHWCLVMLSTALDILGRNSSLPLFHQLRLDDPTHSGSRTRSADEEKPLDDEVGDDAEEEAARDDRTIMVNALCQKLPDLMSTIMLVDDDGRDTRLRLLEMTFLRRVLLCRHVVGRWVIDLLNHGGVPSQRAVDYLQLVSKTTLEDYTGGFRAADSRDKRRYQEERNAVFEAVGGLRGTIASLVTLETKESERAASTAVIWHVMSHKLSRPFVLGLVLIDLILHLSLMTTFRSLATYQNDLTEVVTMREASVVYFISLHYLLRRSCQAWVLLHVSTAAFRGYFSNLWTLFDTTAIVLTLWATLLREKNKEEYLPGMNAVIVGLLWIKVLGFLKVINKQMSTFILALTQILYDIRLFMIVLVVCIFMFGDMFHIAVGTKDNGQYCQTSEDPEDSGTINDFCSSQWSSYLRVYSILLGDFELDDINATTGSTVLFLIFTMFGVVILLNILIAVISDSYEKATMSGAVLFGRARVLYVTQNEALEQFLKPRGNRASAMELELTTEFGSAVLRNMVRWVVLLAILGTASYVLLFLINLVAQLAGQESVYANFILVITFFMAVCLFCALWVVGSFILDGLLRALLPNLAERAYDRIGGVNGWLVRGIANTLFGLNKEKVPSMSSEEEEDWAGRVKYLENVIQRVIAETKVELKSEMLEMKAEMHDRFDEGQG